MINVLEKENCLLKKIYIKKIEVWLTIKSIFLNVKTKQINLKEF